MYKKDKFIIMHTNIQSSKCRINSLAAIVKTLDVNLVTVNETHLKANNKLSIEGFRTFTRNRKDQAMGGIATCVNNKNATTALKVSEGRDDEYIITRHGEFNPAINVINYYGKQESRQSKSSIDEDWENILDEIVKIEAKNEHLVLLGDLNRHLGQYIPGNNEKSSYAGKLLIDFLEKGDYVLVNASSKCKNGPFTRYDRTDPKNETKMSVLI